MSLLNHLNLQEKIVIDIGANSANWTAPLAKLVGDKGTVFAFEADPYYASVTHKTIRLLKLTNVLFFSFGLSDKPETLPLKIVDEFNQRVAGTSHFVDDKRTKGVIFVPVKPLDDLIVLHPDLLEVALIKCDVEGFELRVFKGARKILEKARPIVIAETNMEKSGTRKDETIIGHFEQLNYTAYIMVSQNKLGVSQKANNILGVETPNRIFIPNEFSIPSSLTIFH